MYYIIVYVITRIPLIYNILILIKKIIARATTESDETRAKIRASRMAFAYRIFSNWIVSQAFVQSMAQSTRSADALTFANSPAVRSYEINLSSDHVQSPVTGNHNPSEASRSCFVSSALYPSALFLGRDLERERTRGRICPRRVSRTNIMQVNSRE